MASQALQARLQVVGDSIVDRIRPFKPAIKRREAVFNYVKDIIIKALSPDVEVEVHSFGSLPLGTFLPDGDIDMVIIPRAPAAPDLRQEWCKKLCAALIAEMTQQNQAFSKRPSREPPVPFRVRDPSIVPAEVQVVKCLVNDVKVDIVWAQRQGLGTLVFLEQMDRIVGRDHLLKRSIMLVKAWAYYETRILGSHNFLLSTYALETLVLFVLNQALDRVHTPLDVFREFLAFFGAFPWETRAVTLWGAIPREVLYSGGAPPLPPADQEGLGLLMANPAVRALLAAQPPGPGEEADAKPITVKFLNIVDPLNPRNNLGRSVSRQGYNRITKVLAMSADRMARIFRAGPSEEEEAVRDFEKFFRVTLQVNAFKQGQGQGQRQSQMVSAPPTPTGTSSASHHVSMANGNYLRDAIAAANAVAQHTRAAAAAAAAASHAPHFQGALSNGLLPPGFRGWGGHPHPGPPQHPHLHPHAHANQRPAPAFPPSRGGSAGPSGRSFARSASSGHMFVASGSDELDLPAEGWDLAPAPLALPAEGDARGSLSASASSSVDDTTSEVDLRAALGPELSFSHGRPPLDPLEPPPTEGREPPRIEPLLGVPILAMQPFAEEGARGGHAATTFGFEPPGPGQDAGSSGQPPPRVQARGRRASSNLSAEFPAPVPLFYALEGYVHPYHASRGPGPALSFPQPAHSPGRDVHSRDASLDEAHEGSAGDAFYQHPLHQHQHQHHHQHQHPHFLPPTAYAPQQQPPQGPHSQQPRRGPEHAMYGPSRGPGNLSIAVPPASASRAPPALPAGFNPPLRSSSALAAPNAAHQALQQMYISHLMGVVLQPHLPRGPSMPVLAPGEDVWQGDLSTFEENYRAAHLLGASPGGYTGDLGASVPPSPTHAGARPQANGLYLAHGEAGALVPPSARPSRRESPLDGPLGPPECPSALSLSGGHYSAASSRRGSANGSGTLTDPPLITLASELPVVALTANFTEQRAEGPRARTPSREHEEMRRSVPSSPMGPGTAPGPHKSQAHFASPGRPPPYIMPALRNASSGPPSPSPSLGAPPRHLGAGGPMGLLPPAQQPMGGSGGGKNGGNGPRARPSLDTPPPGKQGKHPHHPQGHSQGNAQQPAGARRALEHQMATLSGSRPGGQQQPPQAKQGHAQHHAQQQPNSGRVPARQAEGPSGPSTAAAPAASGNSGSVPGTAPQPLTPPPTAAPPKPTWSSIASPNNPQRTAAATQPTAAVAAAAVAAAVAAVGLKNGGTRDGGRRSPIPNGSVSESPLQERSSGGAPRLSLERAPEPAPLTASRAPSFKDLLLREPSTGARSSSGAPALGSTPSTSLGGTPTAGSSAGSASMFGLPAGVTAKKGKKKGGDKGGGGDRGENGKIHTAKQQQQQQQHALAAAQHRRQVELHLQADDEFPTLGGFEGAHGASSGAGGILRKSGSGGRPRSANGSSSSVPLPGPNAGGAGLSSGFL